MKLRNLVCLAAIAACGAVAADAPLSRADAAALFARTVQLMEAASVASPELARAGAPIIENARQAVITMRGDSPMALHTGLTNTLLTNVRVFAMLADAVPKPDPFPEEAARQLAELRMNMARIETHFRALLDSREAALANADWANVARYSEANAKTPPPVEGRPRVVFFGDSITDFWRLNEYFQDRDFINRGISGQVTGQLLGRMKTDVIDLKPAAVLILAGTNDIARNVPLPVIQGNLTMIADLANAYGIKPLFASVLPIHDYNKESNPAYEMSRNRPPATILALNQWIKSFCSARGYVYVDYFSQMVDAAGFLRKELADDGLHPNAMGYRIMAPLAQEAIDKALAGSARGRRR
ncbi:MAG: SGNH/GDSL hydrolase family protein [bacterium]|jgi:lysophospholipase L1-like esterase